jgi:hypothetical protein
MGKIDRTTGSIAAKRISEWPSMMDQGMRYDPKLPSTCYLYYRRWGVVTVFTSAAFPGAKTGGARFPAGQLGINQSAPRKALSPRHVVINNDVR